MNAELGLIIISLIKAGLAYRELSLATAEIYKNGGTDEDVAKYLRSRRDAAMAALREIAEG